MGNITCNICKTDAYKDYKNPVLTIHHLGKYNNYRIWEYPKNQVV